MNMKNKVLPIFCTTPPTKEMSHDYVQKKESPYMEIVLEIDHIMKLHVTTTKKEVRLIRKWLLQNHFSFLSHKKLT